MVGVVTALGLSLALTLTMVWIGPRIGFVDVPDDPELKAHDLPAVPLGGVAIFTAVHAGLAVAELFDVRLFVASGLLFVLGLADDRLGLSPILRLAVTAVAGVVLALGYEGALSRVLLVVFVIVAVNAVNLYDGLDGLAGSAAAIAALAVAGVAQLRGLTGWGGVILAAALIGFLVLNWHPAKAFLGDNGAYSVAIFLVWAVAEAGAEPVQISAGFGLLGVFLVDLLVTVLRRQRAKKPLFRGDRSHLYDRVHQTGRSVPEVAVISSAGQVGLCGVVVLFLYLASPDLAAVLTVAFGLSVVAFLTVTKLGPFADPSDS